MSVLRKKYSHSAFNLSSQIYLRTRGSSSPRLFSSFVRPEVTLTITTEWIIFYHGCYLIPMPLVHLDQPKEEHLYGPPQIRAKSVFGAWRGVGALVTPVLKFILRLFIIKFSSPAVIIRKHGTTIQSIYILYKYSGNEFSGFYPLIHSRAFRWERGSSLFTME